MPDKSISDYYDQARAKIKSEEQFKSLLNDRSGPPAPRPSQEFIDRHVGSPRTEAQIDAAVKVRAEKDMRADRPPSSDFVQREKARDMAESIKRQKEASRDRDRDRDR